MSWLLRTLTPTADVVLLERMSLLCLCARLFCLPPEVPVVCADMNVGWPFPPSVWRGALLSDLQGFEHLIDVEVLCRRVKRSLAPGGAAVFTSVRNSQLEGAPRILHGREYVWALGSDETRAFAEEDLLTAWAAGGLPDPKPLEALQGSDNVSLVSGTGGAPPADWAPGPWGELGLVLNPIYRLEASAEEGGRALLRSLPDEFWHTNRATRAHFPEEIQVGPDDLRPGSPHLARSWALPLPPAFLPPDAASS
jgi:hypothetical protein